MFKALAYIVVNDSAHASVAPRFCAELAGQPGALILFIDISTRLWIARVSHMNT